MKLHHHAAAIAVAILWGGNYIAALYGMHALPPFLYTGTRFVLVALMLLPFVPRPTTAQLKQIAGIAFVLGVLHMGIIVAALHQGLTIATAVIIVQLGVPFSCLLAWIVFKDRLGPWRITGIALAFAGLVEVAGAPDILANQQAFWLGVFSALCWGVSNIQLKKLGEVPIFSFLGWMSLFAAPLLLGISWVLEGNPLPYLHGITLNSALAVLYTTFCSTLMAYGGWYFLIRRYDVSRVAPYSLLTPVFGIAFGQIFFQELLSREVMVGGAVTMAGVAIITLRRPKLLTFGKSV